MTYYYCSGGAERIIISLGLQPSIPDEYEVGDIASDGIFKGTRTDPIISFAEHAGWLPRFDHFQRWLCGEQLLLLFFGTIYLLRCCLRTKPTAEKTPPPAASEISAQLVYTN